MAVFTASFTISQATSCESMTIVDTSNYTAEGKGTFSSRKLWIYLSDGTTMIADGSITTTPTYINFSFAGYPSDQITISLKLDYAFEIVFELTSTNPQTGSTYTATNDVGLTCYSKAFAQSLQQGTQAQTALMNDANYKQNLGNLYMEINNVENSISYSVLSSAQNAIDRIYFNYINNPNAF